MDKPSKFLNIRSGNNDADDNQIDDEGDNEISTDGSQPNEMNCIDQYS